MVLFLGNEIYQGSGVTIKHAKQQGRRLRAAGMKHSWSDVFSNDGEYLMYLLPLEVTDQTTFGRIGIHGVEAEIDNWGSELVNIEVSFRYFYVQDKLVNVINIITNIINEIC